jgi:hypothetical protein
VSLANVRSIATAGASYQSEQKGWLPVVPTGIPVPTTINAWITWGGWGKFGGLAWVPPRAPVNIFDISPANRPLNPYLYNERLPTAADLATDPGIRQRFKMPWFRDPSDKIGHQQTWNAFDPSYGQVIPNRDGTSCYEDVGTSYLLQAKWFEQTKAYVGGNWTRAWNLGAARLRASDSFMASRMVWLSDEYADLTMNQVNDNARIVNGYGEINRAVIGFLDGHAKYAPIIPGGEGDPRRTTQPWLVPAYSNAEYTVVFPDLR